MAGADGKTEGRKAVPTFRLSVLPSFPYIRFGEYAPLLTIAEPTRLRILNCLAAAPPQPTVSRHLQVLRRLEVVRNTPITRFVRAERERATERSRSHSRTWVPV